jgi:Do/DeqQ family serine protease
MKHSVLLLCATLAAAPGLHAQSPATPVSVARQLEQEFVAAFDKVAPAVVVIDVQKPGGEGMNPWDYLFGDPDNENAPRTPQRRSPRRDLPPQLSGGSGFIIREDGYIISNNHVIENATRITVHLKDGRKLAAKVIGTDPRADIALIKVEAKGLPVAKLGSSERTRVGQWSLAIGAPFSLDYSYSMGIISGKGRGGLQPGQYVQYLQTTAPINPGNSGGPLVNIDGEVVGVNTMIRGIGTGVGFAVPVDLVRDVADQLITNGKVTRPWLGIRILSVRDAAEMEDMFADFTSGVVVQGIEAAAPASGSELRPLDVITAVNGKRVDTASDLQSSIIGFKVGEEVKLAVKRLTRGGTARDMEIAVKLGQMPGDLTLAARGPQPQQPAVDDVANPLGMRVRDLTPELRERFKVKAEQGVIITELDEEGPAFEVGLRPGTVVTAVNQEPVRTVEEFNRALSSADLKRGVMFFIVQDGTQTYSFVKAPSGG